MRKKKPYQILTFHTTSAAMAMELYCKEHDIPGRLIPVPRELSAGGGLGGRIPPEAYDRHNNTLRGSNIESEPNVELVI